MTPLKVSTAGKSVSWSDPPNVGNARNSDRLSLLVPVYVKVSEADAICDEAGHVRTVVGDAAADFAGLASAGDERDELYLLLATETALSSSMAPLPKLGLIVGVEDMMVGEEPEEGLLVMLPCLFCAVCCSSMDGRSEGGASNVCVPPTSSCAI